MLRHHPPTLRYEKLPSLQKSGKNVHPRTHFPDPTVNILLCRLYYLSVPSVHSIYGSVLKYRTHSSTVWSCVFKVHVIKYRSVFAYSSFPGILFKIKFLGVIKASELERGQGQESPLKSSQGAPGLRSSPGSTSGCFDLSPKRSPRFLPFPHRGAQVSTSFQVSGIFCLKPWFSTGDVLAVLSGEEGLLASSGQRPGMPRTSSTTCGNPYKEDLSGPKC